MDKKYILSILFIIILIICATFIFTANHAQKTNLIIINNDTLFNFENMTIQLLNEENMTISNATVELNITNEFGNTTTFSHQTNSEGKASFNLSSFIEGNYTANALFKGNNSYKPSNATQKLTINEHKQTESSSNSNKYDPYYNEDDYLSSEELKAKYPDKSDFELFETYGERGPGGKTYDGRYVSDIRRENPGSLAY